MFPLKIIFPLKFIFCIYVGPSCWMSVSFCVCVFVCKWLFFFCFIFCSFHQKLFQIQYFLYNFVVINIIGKTLIIFFPFCLNIFLWWCFDLLFALTYWEKTCFFLKIIISVFFLNIFLFVIICSGLMRDIRNIVIACDFGVFYYFFLNFCLNKIIILVYIF